MPKQDSILAIVAGVVFAVCALPIVAYLVFAYFVASIGTSIGANDGPHAAPLLLAIVLPIGGGLVLIGGIVFALTRLARKRPAQTGASERTPPTSSA